jgi:protein ImuB
MMVRRLLSIWLPEFPNSAAPWGDLEALALWCQKFSPLTAAVPPDGVVIDITGCAHLFGGESGLREKLLAQLPGARCAIANTALAAWGLARFGERESEDLRPLPLAALGLDDRTVVKLRRVGIRRIGELMRLPRAELTAGYGQGPVRKLAQAMGRAPEVLKFVSAPPAWREVLHFAEPISAPEQLQVALGKLAGAVCEKLSDGWLGATVLTAVFYRVDSQRPKISLHFASPCRDEGQIVRLLHEKLGEVDPGFGVDAVSLEAGATESLAPAQISIEREERNFAVPIDILLNRLGPRKIWRVEERQTHVPERVVLKRPVNLPPVPWNGTKNSLPRGKRAYPRPIKILQRPDAIAAIAPVPDDPPASFSWRGKSHRIRRATGPERIAREWWRHEHDDARPEAEKIRDYYAVEDFEGRKFWVFRAGLHDGVSPVRWYIHGFF